MYTNVQQMCKHIQKRQEIRWEKKERNECAYRDL